MENTRTLLLFLVLMTSALAWGSSCSAGCRLPDCRCWDDISRPGNFSNDGTPQIIALTFTYAMNHETTSHYLPLFKDLVNPNGCPVKGTFFVQDNDTEVATLTELFKLKHELALTAANGRIPTDRRSWVESLFKSSEKLYDAGVPRREILGVRSPSLFMGGNDELQAEVQFGMKYDSSCVTDPNMLVWPYTYDSVNNVPKCAMGVTPNRTFPGMWQFLMPEMSIRGHKCASLGSCSPWVRSVEDAFTLLFNSFAAHYYKGRSPMVLSIDPHWLSKDVQVQGLMQFLDVVGRFQDTWMVTMTEALEWIRYPVPMYPSVRYLPWDCPQEEKRPPRT